ncbi:MAG: 2,3-diphosphoglycerate-dependent phosphoglycerate mutase [Buchnera aphidicola (Eriosoma harunire)]
MKIKKLVLIRHGESEWNELNKFTGWYDAKLSKKGKEEAYLAGKLLKLNGFHFNIAYTSMLTRAITTLWIILDVLNQSWLTVEKSWCLNERHYGALQGLNKLETEHQYGSNQVNLWRRSFKIIPPSIDKSDKRFPGHDIRYQNVSQEKLPISESLELTLKRVALYWNDVIKEKLNHDNTILIVAHGNSLRALIKYISYISDIDIMKINIPTGMPIIYEFNTSLKPIKYYYLHDTKNHKI